MNIPSAADYDREIIRAIGAEMQAARYRLSLTRQAFVERLPIKIPVNTYACYEQGVRPVPIARLVLFCQGLGVSTPQLIHLALQRIQLELETFGVLIDVDKVAADKRGQLEALRQWARNRLAEDAPTADRQQPFVVRLPWVVVKEMATLCGASQGEMLDYVREFAPDAAPLL